MELLPSPWSPVEVRQLVDAPREEVFAVVADTETHAKWFVGVPLNRDDTDDEPVEELETHGHRQIVLEERVGPLTNELEFDFIKRGDRTEVVMRERPTGNLVALTPLLRPAFALRNRQSLQRLRRYVESR
jgi:uncharacterized protein YndB with AHSA1/START domain